MGEVIPTNAPTEALSLEDVLLRQPLYAEMSFSRIQRIIADLRLQSFQVDAFCAHCESPSIFKAYRTRIANISARDCMGAGAFSAVLQCSRDAKHVYSYWFVSDGEFVRKVGQWPSMEDIAGADIEKFRPLLKGGLFAELHRATGLASHGIGIGAYAYLRRIFERLIERHRIEFEESHAAIERFDSLRMDEKIEALASVLPDALVRSRAIYGILSKGIHELDEGLCLSFFPVLRAAIIEILEQDLHERTKKEAADNLDREVQRIAGLIREGVTGDGPDSGKPKDR